MSDRERVYVWAAVPEGLTLPDRSHVLRRIVRQREGTPVPERRTFLRSSSTRVEGEDRSAELIFWLGTPENLDREAAEQHGVEILTEPTVATEPELPEDADE